MNTMLGALVALVPAAAPLWGLNVDQGLVDRGTVKGGPALTHAFKLTAPAGSRWTITGVESGCGCVRHAVSKTDLGPGEIADLVVEVNTLTQPDGPNTWRFDVTYRQATTGQSGTLRVRLTATIVREVRVTPPMMAVSTDGEATHDITVTDTRPTPFTITRTATTAAFLSAAVRPATGGTTVVRVTVTAAAPVGVHDETVVLATSDPAYPELRVPVRVTKQPKDAVRATPAAVDLAVPRDGSPAAAVVQFRTANGSPVEVAKAVTTAAGVSLKWSAGGGPVATLRVGVSPAAGRSGTATVTVTFAAPAGREAVVPVSWGD